MVKKKQLIQFLIQNQTDCEYNLQMFVNNVFSVNATTKYSWDITTETVSCGTATIVVNGQTLTITYEPTLAGLLNALNALGYGFFCTQTIGANTFLYVTDNTNVYNDLTLCATGASTTTTTTTSSTSTSTSSTSSTTTLPPTSTTTTSSTTSSTTLPGTSTTTSSTTSTTTAPTTSTTTTTTTESLVTNLIFDLLATVGGYTVSDVQVNNVVPTLTGGSDVPFSTDTHSYSTNQIGSNQFLEITIIDFTLNGCITVTDSNGNVSQQNIIGNQVYTFTGLIIDNITPVTVVFTDGNC